MKTKLISTKDYLPKNDNPKLEGVNLLPELPSKKEDIVLKFISKIKDIMMEVDEELRGGKFTEKIHFTHQYIDNFEKEYKADKQSDKKYSNEGVRLLKRVLKEVTINHSSIPNQIDGYLQSLNTTKEPTGLKLKLKKYVIIKLMTLGRNKFIIINPK